MPVIAPIMKVENCKKYGATVVSFGQNLGESREKALEIAKEKDFLYINGYVIAEIPNALIFYRPKMFCACPIFFGQTKNLIVLSATTKKIVPGTKINLLDGNHHMVRSKKIGTRAISE